MLNCSFVNEAVDENYERTTTTSSTLDSTTCRNWRFEHTPFVDVYLYLYLVRYELVLGTTTVGHTLVLSDSIHTYPSNSTIVPYKKLRVLN
jgi:hypothetical protein